MSHVDVAIILSKPFHDTETVLQTHQNCKPLAGRAAWKLSTQMKGALYLKKKHLVDFVVRVYTFKYNLSGNLKYNVT